MKLLFLFISIFVIAIVITSKNTKINEYFNGCKIVNYDYKYLFTPINMIRNPIKRFQLDPQKKYIDITDGIDQYQFEDILNSMKIIKPKYMYKELKPIQYDYFKNISYDTVSLKKIDNMLSNLYDSLKKHIENEIYKKYNEFCNNINRCNLVLNKRNVLKIGTNSSGNSIFEGQLLVSFKNKYFYYLINYVISDENKFSIHSLKLTGYDLKPVNKRLNQFSTISIDNKYVNIYSNPIFNTYKGKQGYYVSDNEKGILKTNQELDKLLEDRLKLEQENLFKCYGKFAINKDECESKYDKFNKIQNTVGVWDRECKNDNECPFFGKNKNYPNTFGGCRNGKCQMPVGVVSVSPRLFIKEDEALCYNCKSGFRCCDEQKNRNNYPKLSSPDYNFENDMETRMNNAYILKDKGLKVL